MSEWQSQKVSIRNHQNGIIHETGFLFQRYIFESVQDEVLNNSKHIDWNIPPHPPPDVLKVSHINSEMQPESYPVSWKYHPKGEEPWAEAGEGQEQPPPSTRWPTGDNISAEDADSNP